MVGASQCIFYFIKHVVHNEKYGKDAVDSAVEFKAIWKDAGSLDQKRMQLIQLQILLPT